jgi:hypothetical protein
MASDEEDSLLVTIVGSPNAKKEPETATERSARLVVDACADYFSELSLHLRKLMNDLSADLKPWFPQIAGGALQAQLLVILEDLRKKEDFFGAELLVEFGRQIASRVNETFSSTPASPRRYE